MHHPIQFQTIAKIKHAEMLKEAAELRAAQDTSADNPRPITRWLVVTLAFAALALGLTKLIGLV